MITLHHLGSLRWTFANIICSFLRQGKMSVSPRPKANGLFSPLFSLSKNWIHHEVWGCAELIPASRRIRIPQSKSPSGHKPLGSNLLAGMDPRNPQVVMDPCRWFRPPPYKTFVLQFSLYLEFIWFFLVQTLCQCSLETVSDQNKRIFLFNVFYLMTVICMVYRRNMTFFVFAKYDVQSIITKS